MKTRNLCWMMALSVLLGLTIGQSGRAEPEPWQPVSGPYGGSVAALAMSPNYPIDHTVFAGLRGQGVYRTTDLGDSWHPVGPGGWVVTDLAISPAYADDQTLFAATGLWTTGYSVYRSTDEGLSWQEVSPVWSHLPHAPRLAISPDFVSDRTIYVLGTLQTYVSTDGGDTFAPATGWFATHHVSHLGFSPAYATDHTLFALVPSDGLYKSTDGGATWNPTGLLTSLSTFAVSPDYANDQTLLAVGESNGQLYLSIDGGGSWPEVALILGTGGQHTLLFSPTFATDNVVLAASSSDPGPYRSQDGGTAWEPVGWYDPASPYEGFAGGSVFALALAPASSFDAAAYAGTSSGIYRSNNFGSYWYQRSNGLPCLTVRALAMAPGDPDRMLAGTSFFEHLRSDTSTPGEYDGNLQLSTDGGQTWRDVSGRLDRVQQVVFSPGFTNDDTAFAATGTLGQHGYADGGVYRSTDGGLTWSEVLSDRICKALAISPSFATDRTLWVSASTYSSALGLQVSTDGGDHWTSLAPAVHAAILIPSPNYAVDHTLFAGTPDSGLQRSTDSGAHWTQVLNHPVTALALSPAYGASRTLYAGVKDPPGEAGQIYRSSDGGATWQPVDTGIPGSHEGDPLTVSALAFATDGSVLAGVYYGSEAGGGAVYRSTDGGDTWQAVGEGLEPYNLFTLATIPSGSMTFYAGTDTLKGRGGGLWELAVPQGGPAEPGTWETHGPRGGRALALEVSPDFASDGVVLTGEYRPGRYGDQSGLGIFRSTDGGQTWQPSSSGTEGRQYSSAIHDFAFSPDFIIDQTVFAATWGGLFESTDGGEHWQWVSRIFRGYPGSISAVAVAPDFSTSGHVIAGSGWGGVYVSQDRGLNWTVDYPVGAATDIVYSPDFGLDSTAFAGAWGIWKTTDRGLSWTQVMTEGISVLAISPQFGTDGTLFAGRSDGLAISYDGGTTWLTRTVSTESPFITALAISPQFGTDQTLFAGNSKTLHRSNDGGLSWSPVAGYPDLPVRALALSPDWPAHSVLLVGTDQGVYRTIDGGATWARMQGLTPSSVRSLAMPPGDSPLVAGTFGQGVHASTNGGQTWFPMGLQDKASSDIWSVAISPEYDADRTVFALDDYMYRGGNVVRTTDGGVTWEPVWGTSYPLELTISPQYGDDHTVFSIADGYFVMGSFDGGETWSQVGQWPSLDYYPAWVVALPPNYSTDGTLFAGASGFWRLPPAATTWELAASGLLTDTYVTALAVSPDYAADTTLLATGWWYEEGWVPHDAFFRSTDGGLHWELVGTGLPPAIGGPVIFSPSYATDGVAYLLAEGGLYRSLDGGLSWTRVGAPEHVGLGDLVVGQDGDVYVASGAGVWRYSTPAWDIIINGGSEADSGWSLPGTPRPAAYSSEMAYDGERSLRVGIVNTSNGNAYSSGRQMVTIPTDTLTATLHCYVYSVSSESAQVSLNQAFPEGRMVGNSAPAVPAAGDAQYLLIMEPGTNRIIETLFWTLSNTQSWQHHTFDLSTYAGRTIWLHYGVFNDGQGGQTGMYVDNVSLIIQRPAPEKPTYRIYLPLALRGYTAMTPIGVSGLAISGPTSGMAHNPYTFTAAASPANATLPITYTWQATGQPPVTHTGGLSDTASFTWSVTGTQAITVTASNTGGMATSSHLITISQTTVLSGPLLIDGQWVFRVVGHPQSVAIYGLTTGGLYRSDDGARTWTLMNPSPIVTHSLVLAPSQPNILYADASMGYPCYQDRPSLPMWKSTDSGQTWLELPAGHNLEPMAVHPGDPLRVYARGCTTPWFSSDGGATWTEQPDDLFMIWDVRSIAPAPADDWQTVYLGCSSEGGAGVIIGSTNGGADWVWLTPTDPVPLWVSALAVDPISPTHVYFGEPYGFWGSHDGGTTWFTSTNGLEDVVYDPGGPITQTYGLLSLAYVASDLDHWLLGTASGLYRSADRGHAWTQFSGTPWEDERIEELLLRWVEPDRLFLTTPSGVYVYHLEPFSIE